MFEVLNTAYRRFGRESFKEFGDIKITGFLIFNLIDYWFE